MKLREYQAEAVALLYSEWKHKRKGLLCMATGAGKSELAAYVVRDAMMDSVPVVMVVRGKELVNNLSQRLDKYKIDHSVFMADHYRYNPGKLVQICSVDTIQRRKKFPHVDKQCIVLLDECHKNYDIIFDNYKTQFIMGMSATPFENAHNFDFYVKPIDAYELRDKGHLVPERIFCPSVVDTSSVKIVAGDFQKDQIANLMSQSKVVGDVIEDWIRLGEDRPTVCFAVSVEHSKQLRDAFLEKGISAVHCDADSTAEERRNAEKGLLSGTIKVICNVDIFSVGWDCPPVSCIILARPTWSLIWYLQAIGRGLRSFPGKSDCIVLDNAGNVFRHGTPYRIRDISLEPKKKGSKTIRDDISVTTCKDCYFVFESELGSCPECGWTRPPREVKTASGVLVEYMESEEEKKRQLTVKIVKEYYSLDMVQKRRGLKPNFKFYKIKEKFGTEGLKILQTQIRELIPTFLF